MHTFAKDQLPAKPKILLIKLRSIGDVIYNTAVYDPIKKTWPDALLKVVVERAAFDLVKHHPAIDEVLVFEKASLASQVGFYLKLWRERFDMAIDMHEGPRGAIMCFLTFARLRVGNALAKRSFFYNVKLDFSEFKPQLPIDFQLGLVKKMGVETHSAQPVIHIANASRQRANKLLEGKGLQKPFVIIHPGARVYDQWQYEKFAEVADRLSQKYGLAVLLTCGPGQREQADKVLSHIRHARAAFIETGLQELGAITEMARLVVCHNGGYMHLAAVLGTPVIALFGLANPEIWRPKGSHCAILHHKLECFPCSSKTIRDICTSGKPECKEKITVDEAMAAADKLITKL